MSDTLTSFELKDTDIAPTLGNATGDKAPLRCQHDGCTNAVTKPPRGRTPKFCEEHKATSSSSSRSATSGKSWPRAVEIETILTQYVVGIGTGISLINAIDGQVIASSGPTVIHELVELAKTDKAIRKYLEWLATPGKYAPLTMAVMGLALPILGNHGMLPQFHINLPTDRGE
jgi:hypothetical protein